MNLLKTILLLLFCSTQLPAQNSNQDSVHSTSPRYTVYYFLGEDCQICKYYAPELHRLDRLYRSDSLSFIGLFPNRYSNEEGIDSYRKEYAITFPLKREYFGTKAQKFEVSITPEVVIHDAHIDKVVYRGRIDDAYVSVGKRKRILQSRDLEAAVINLVEGEPVETPVTQAVGCYITFR